MTLANDIIQEVSRAGGAASLVPQAEADRLVASVRSKFAEPGTQNILWHCLVDSESMHDPDGWKCIEPMIGGGEFFMLIKDYDRHRMVKISRGDILTVVLGETVGFEFYVFDSELNYLICFNDHDMLIGAGQAAEWVRSLRESLGR
ncbi:MAG: hypothetical protein HC927_10245 [Deltaproteobacteria bacterium]|nr:hypothetical protein [Deltaproteobacteria bacterium]